MANLIRPIGLALGLLSAIWILMAVAGAVPAAVAARGRLAGRKPARGRALGNMGLSEDGKTHSTEHRRDSCHARRANLCGGSGEQRRTYVPADVRALQTEMVKLQYRELNSVGSIASFLARRIPGKARRGGETVRH